MARACSTHGRGEMHTKCRSKNVNGKKHSEDLDVDVKIILELILDRMGRYELAASGSGQGPVASCCEHGNEPSGSVKCVEFLEQLNDHQRHNKDSVLNTPVEHTWAPSRLCSGNTINLHSGGAWFKSRPHRRSSSLSTPPTSLGAILRQLEQQVWKTQQHVK
jgi:hypothetical protein